MVTTFFGARSFGGDAVGIDFLSRALLRRGHEVHVIYSPDAFELVRDHQSPHANYVPPDGLKLHPIESRAGRLSPLWTHQTGRLGFRAAAIRKILDGNPFDVVHFHNISLIGALGILSLPSGPRPPVKLMTVHEFWLLCPLSTLWKFNREICREPECTSCMIRAGRPPQFWRQPASIQRALDNLDALIFPSRHTLSIHQEHGIRASRLRHIPHFIAQDWACPPPAAGLERISASKPYFAAAGRLVNQKGFDRLISLMASLPEMELRIAGAGPEESRLRRLAAGNPRVHFLGHLSHPDLAVLFREAIAVVVPSVFYETFGYVVVESLSVGTPVIVHDCGALPELIEASGAGLTYRTDEELLCAMRRLATEPHLREQLSQRGLQATRQVWSESSHLERYFSLIDEVRAERQAPAPATT